MSKEPSWFTSDHYHVTEEELPSGWTRILFRFRDDRDSESAHKRWLDMAHPLPKRTQKPTKKRRSKA